MFDFLKRKQVEVDYVEFAKKVIDYIKKCRELGKSDEYIKQQLKQKEYPDTLIDYVFKRVENIKEISFEEEVFKTLRLGKKYLIKTGNIEKTFNLMEKRTKKFVKGGDIKDEK